MPLPGDPSPRPKSVNDLLPAFDVIRYGIKPTALREMADRLLRKLPPADLQHPATALHLPAVLARRLGTHGTIAAVLRRVRYDQIHPSNWSDRMRGQLDLLLRNLLADLQQFGSIRWKNFRVPQRPPPPAPSPAVVARLSALLEKHWARLAPAEWARSPGYLHLHKPSMANLLRLKITTLGELRAALHAGGDHLPRPGVPLWSDLEKAIPALAPAIREDGSVDWVQYAAGRGFAIFPEEPGPIAPGDYPARVVETIAAILKNHFAPEHAAALDAPYLRLAAAHVPIRERARSLGASIPQVVARERSVMVLLQAVFQRGDCSGCRFRLREEITAPLRELRAALGEVPDGPLEIAPWDRLIAERWGPEAVGKDFFRRLLPALLGLGRPGWGTAPPKPQQSLTTLAAALLASTPGGLTLAELRKRAGRAPAYKDAAELEASLRRSSTVFFFDGRYHLGSYKSVLADECERLLRRAARPLRPVELAWAIQPLMPGRTLTSLRAACTAAMRDDKAGRFRPGKGKIIYGLADWPHPIVPLAEAVADVFRALPGPLKTAALVERIQRVNPVAQSDLVDFLAQSTKIRRLGFSLWEWIGGTPQTSAQPARERPRQG